MAEEESSIRGSHKAIKVETNFVASVCC